MRVIKLRSRIKISSDAVRPSDFTPVTLVLVHHHHHHHQNKLEMLFLQTPAFERDLM